MPVASVNQDLWRGANYPPIVWGFGSPEEPLIPEGGLFELEVRFSSAQGPRVLTIAAGHPSLPVDYEQGTVTWAYAPEQVAEMVPTLPITYSLRFVDDPIRQVWVIGRFAVKG